MCGIAGILNINNKKEITADCLEKMLVSLEHRGPDEFGIFIEKEIGLGHARLSIIDISGGKQPMSNEDKSIWITFNGEIFNYLELREDLLKKGHQFTTNSDTETIIHLYEDYGADCLKYLNGQFVFAIWDNNKKELFIARDRLGIRPLFYTKQNNRFYFASEIKAILATGEIRSEIDPEALDQIFTFWHSLPPQTAFKDINELPPAHYLIIKNNNIQEVKYWDITFSEEKMKLPFEEAAEALRELLIDATRLQLRSDVPVGAYLSGGLDSSVTTALIRNFSNSPIETFSVAFEDKNYDESIYQKEVSRALNTVHHEIRCTYSDISLNFPKVIWHTEKPILRTAPAPLFMLSKLVRESNFKVVLTGEGADEILGGYDIFKETKIREFCARFPDSKYRPMLLKKLYPYLPAFQGQSKAYREAFFNDGLSTVSDDFFSHKPRWQTTSKAKLFFSDEFKNKITGSPEGSLIKSIPSDFHKWPPVAKAQYLETKFLLPGYILSSQGDRVSMANSVEGRFPFLDHRVVEFCAKLPPAYKIKVLNEKYILKKCMKKYLPDVITKRTKQPYLAPESRSFFHNGKFPDYAEELLSNECINKYGYFNPNAVRILINKCRKGAIGFKDNMAFVGILSTQLLHNQYVDNFVVNQNVEEKNIAIRT